MISRGARGGRGGTAARSTASASHPGLTCSTSGRTAPNDLFGVGIQPSFRLAPALRCTHSGARTSPRNPKDEELGIPRSRASHRDLPARAVLRVSFLRALRVLRAKILAQGYLTASSSSLDFARNDDRWRAVPPHGVADATMGAFEAFMAGRDHVVSAMLKGKAMIAASLGQRSSQSRP